jgi:threonine synthase
VGREETAVLLLTGHTLKDPEYTIKYHRGELLTDAEMAGASDAELARHAALRREPVVLEAQADAVLRVLDSFVARPAPTP